MLQLDECCREDVWRSFFRRKEEDVGVAVLPAIPREEQIVVEKPCACCSDRSMNAVRSCMAAERCRDMVRSKKETDDEDVESDGPPSLL